MPVQTTVLDVSKGVGFGLLYHPIIGQKKREKSLPFVPRLAAFRTKKFKKGL